MNSPIVSIIIPVYNVEKYLHQCVDSVIAQTFTNFEVLLIDDGSTDASREICDKYVRKDKRIRVFHKRNGGVSSARNLGLEKALGKWVSFVDADDWIEKDMVDNLISFCKSEADTILCSARSVRPNGEQNLFNLDNRFFDSVDSFLAQSYHHWAVWGYLLSVSIIRNNKIHFEEQISMSEDCLFLIKYFSYAHSFHTLKKELYNYRINDTSCCNSPITFKKAYSHLLAAKGILKNALDRCDSPLFLKIQNDLACNCLCNFINGICRIRLSKEQWTETRIFYPVVNMLKSRRVPLSIRLSNIIGLKVFRLIYKMKI